MRKNNFVFLLTLALMMLSSKFTMAQHTAKWDIKLSYSTIHSMAEAHRDLFRSGELKPHFRIDGTYSIFKNFDAGLYLGYSSLNHFHPEMYETSYTDENGVSTKYMRDGYDATNSYFYGLKCNYHLLALFAKTEKSRFDIYATAKVGAVTESWIVYQSYELDSNTRSNATNLEYGIGLGASYNFTKNIGLFGEYTVGHFINDENTRFHIGIGIKF